MAERVIDCSAHQASYRPTAGMSSVMLRIAYQKTKDKLFENFYANANAAGLRIGIYGFATWHYAHLNQRSVAVARQLMHDQINTWLSYMNGHNLKGWIAIDQELEASCQMGLSAADNTQLLNEAIALLSAAGYAGQVCIYCSASWIPAHTLVDRLAAPLWLAYYYADPSDPDFDAAQSDYRKLGTKWGKYMAGLGDRVIAWQYGRIGYGAKYGVGSANIDRNWFYATPNSSTPTGGNTMKFLSVFGDKNCQCFTTTDVNAVDYSYNNGTLVSGVCYPLMSDLGNDAAGLHWVRIYAGGANRHAVVLADRSNVVELSPGDAIPAVLAQGTSSDEALRAELAAAQEATVQARAEADAARTAATNATNAANAANSALSSIKSSNASIATSMKGLANQLQV